MSRILRALRKLRFRYLNTVWETGWYNMHDQQEALEKTVITRSALGFRVRTLLMYVGEENKTEVISERFQTFEEAYRHFTLPEGPDHETLLLWEWARAQGMTLVVASEKFSSQGALAFPHLQMAFVCKGDADATCHELGHLYNHRWGMGSDEVMAWHTGYAIRKSVLKKESPDWWTLRKHCLKSYRIHE